MLKMSRCNRLRSQNAPILVHCVHASSLILRRHLLNFLEIEEKGEVKVLSSAYVQRLRECAGHNGRPRRQRLSEVQQVLTSALITGKD